ncbi:hypothetical protein ACFL2O_02310 [Thermodesulfobacteriota bacterium]
MKPHSLRLVLVEFLAVLFILCTGCSNSSDTSGALRHYPVKSLEGLIDQRGVEFDRDASSDGNGSLLIHAQQPMTVHLYETGDIDVDNARLEYRAKIKTKDVKGRVYLEMWCRFPGKGEYFSRDLGSPVTGTRDWSGEMTPFFLKKGENPENVKLNLVVDGVGTVWIDDIHLIQSPLH